MVPPRLKVQCRNNENAQRSFIQLRTETVLCCNSVIKSGGARNAEIFWLLILDNVSEELMTDTSIDKMSGGSTCNGFNYTAAIWCLSSLVSGLRPAAIRVIE